MLSSAKASGGVSKPDSDVQLPTGYATARHTVLQGPAENLLILVN